ncbi:MAG TPA: DNA-formamidopyrimidine glycosylase family protein [Actinomycetota bacterium]|nr:DNA-formamidopyrimidine glycosylase family protein [Actinomycetota bacterium]
MPELPDVEAYRRRLSRHARGRRVRRTVVTDPGILRNVGARALDRALQGARFEEPERHGKWLIAWTTGPAVLIHFGMTGDLQPAAGSEGRHRHDRVIFELDRGELRYRNMRKLGGLWLAHDAGEAHQLLGALGPDALGLGRGRFVEAVGRRRGRVKAVLMDQTVVSGIGNLLADEALWRARIHPATPVHRLRPEDLAALHRALARVLRTSVERHGNVPSARGWLTAVRGRPGATCPRCRTPLARTVVGGRTTYLCPACQAPREGP